MFMLSFHIREKHFVQINLVHLDLLWLLDIAVWYISVFSKVLRVVIWALMLTFMHIF